MISNITPVNRFISARIRCRRGMAVAVTVKARTPAATNALPIASGSQFPSPTMNAAKRSLNSLLFECGEDRVDHLLRVAEQHARVLFVEERIVHARVAARHAPLHDDAGLRLPHFEDRHAVDRA